jgi:hypothetical protein
LQKVEEWEEQVLQMAVKCLTNYGLMVEKIQDGRPLGYLRDLVYRDCASSQRIALRLDVLEDLDACQKLLENFEFKSWFDKLPLTRRGREGKGREGKGREGKGDEVQIQEETLLSQGNNVEIDTEGHVASSSDLSTHTYHPHMCNYTHTIKHTHTF